MRWDERRVAMLEAMGIRLWAPALPVEVIDAASSEGGEGVRASPAAEASAVVARPAARGVAPAEPPVRARPPAPVAGRAQVGREAPDAAPRAPSGLAWVRPAAPVVPTILPAGEWGIQWATLAADAAACTACGLCAGRTRSVFASGGPPADWLVVGEPPVEAEDRDGAPFAGKPGQLLDNMLRAVGVSRGDDAVDAARRACLTLPVKCRPPGNRAPTPDELRTCESRYLVPQIEWVRPKLILALGRAAALLLGSDEPLGKLRGRVHRYRDLPLVASYHPGYLLRNPADKARAWEDLCLAMETLRGEPT